mgnify:FL=1
MMIVVVVGNDNTAAAAQLMIIITKYAKTNNSRIVTSYGKLFFRRRVCNRHTENNAVWLMQVQIELKPNESQRRIES